MNYQEAKAAFAKDKAIGAPLISLHAVPDLPKQVQNRLFFVRFEDLIEKPAACMSHLYAWLGLSPFQIDPARLATRVQESDSHYHMKYTHRQSDHIAKPRHHDIPPRIQAQIESAYAWFYQMYYAGGKP